VDLRVLRGVLVPINNRLHYTYARGQYTGDLVHYSNYRRHNDFTNDRVHCIHNTNDDNISQTPSTLSELRLTSNQVPREDWSKALFKNLDL
jgi:hypothetical protein